MVVGDIGVIEHGAVLQLHLEPPAEILQRDVHALNVDHFEDNRFGLLGRHLGFLQLGPVADLELLTNSLHFFLGDIFRHLHKVLLW
jgi:hypothetical protein